MADNATKIAALQSVLDTGATDVSVDGETVKYDPAARRSSTARPSSVAYAAPAAANEVRSPSVIRCSGFHPVHPVHPVKVPFVYHSRQFTDTGISNVAV